MKSTKDSVVLDLTETQLWLAERQPTGFLVALWLEPETSEKLALSGGESSDSLHITLAYCGEADEMGELVQARAITAIADAVQYWNPLTGKIGGYGRFIASESSDSKDVFYATPDVPNLTEIRQCIVNCLSDQGIPASTNHGYTPHITLSYLDPGAANPVESLAPLELTFRGVTVVVGPRKIEIPFWYGQIEAEASISMGDAVEEIPLAAPLGSIAARPLLFSVSQEWISYLPKPGNYAYREGRTLDFSAEAYDRILENFNKNVYKQDLPINVEHDSIAAGAIGWIKPGCMRLADDGSIEVKPEWTPTGKELIEGDRFRYTSAELALKWQDPVTREWHQDVPVGLAVCTRPHFKTDVLQPLSASEALAFAEVEASMSDPADPTKEEPVVVPPVEEETKVPPKEGEGESVPNPDESGNPGEGNEVAEEKVEAKEEIKVDDLKSVSLNDLTQIVLTAEQRRTERQMFTDLTTRAELAERRATTAETELKAYKTERRTDKFTAEVIGRSAENGTAWFGAPKENVEHLVSLAEQFGDDSPEVRWAITQKRNEARAIKATGLFDPISIGATESGASANAQVSLLVDQLRLANPKLSSEEAMNQVYQDNPELYIKSLQK